MDLFKQKVTASQDNTNLLGATDADNNQLFCRIACPEYAATCLTAQGVPADLIEDFIRAANAR